MLAPVNSATPLADKRGRRRHWRAVDLGDQRVRMLDCEGRHVRHKGSQVTGFAPAARAHVREGVDLGHRDLPHPDARIHSRVSSRGSTGRNKTFDSSLGRYPRFASVANASTPASGLTS